MDAELERDNTAYFTYSNIIPLVV